MSQITKKALSSAFRELLETKPISKITISDITDKAGVNRHTFYYHFNDINDMLAWSFATKIKELLEDHISYDNWEDAFMVLLDFCTKQRKFILAIFHSESKDHVLRQLNEWVYTLLRNVLEEQSVGMHVYESDKDYIARFYQYGFVGMLTSWLENGMMEEPAQIIKQLGILVHGDLKDALTRFEQATMRKN